LRHDNFLIFSQVVWRAENDRRGWSQARRVPSFHRFGETMQRQFYSRYSCHVDHIVVVSVPFEGSHFDNGGPSLNTEPLSLFKTNGGPWMTNNPANSNEFAEFRKRFSITLLPQTFSPVSAAVGRKSIQNQ